MSEKQENKMGTKPVVPLIIGMSLPAILSMTVSALYNVVDSYFVAGYSTDAFTALSIAFPLQMIMVAIGVGTGVGINSLVSRRLGEGKKEEAEQAARNGIFLAVCSWFLMLLIGAFFSRPFFEMTTSDTAVVNYGIVYIRICMMASLGAFMQMIIEKTLQATGNMILPMCSQLIGCILNIILDPILIYGYFGAPRMGIAGAALATVIGQWIGMFFCIYAFFVRQKLIHVSFRGFRPDIRIIKNIYQVGVPSIVMQSITSFMVTLMNLILIQFGKPAVNVLGIYFKLQSFIFMPVFGLNQGLMPVLGYNFGARLKNRMKQALATGMIGAGALMAFGTVIFHVFPNQLIQIFSPDEATVAIGVPALRIISLCFVPAAIGITSSTLFQAMGMGVRSLIVSLVRQLIFLLPSAFILARLGGEHYVWYSFVIGEVFSLILCICFLLDANRRVIRNL